MLLLGGLTAIEVHYNTLCAQTHWYIFFWKTCHEIGNCFLAHFVRRPAEQLFVLRYQIVYYSHLVAVLQPDVAIFGVNNLDTMHFLRLGPGKRPYNELLLFDNFARYLSEFVHRVMWLL